MYYYSYAADPSSVLYFLTLVLFVVSLIISGLVRSRFNKYSKTTTAAHLTGADAAMRILRANGVTDVTIQPVSGSLTDNYNPTNRTLNLSESVINSSSVSAVAVAAHECGHALQHAERYPLLMARKAMAPVCSIGSMGSYIAILLGILFSMQPLIGIGAALFGIIVVFNLITLPVEVDASRRALAQVESLGLLNEEELKAGAGVLRAAGLTYFVSLMTSIVQFLRLLSLARKRN